MNESDESINKRIDYFESKVYDELLKKVFHIESYPDYHIYHFVLNNSKCSYLLVPNILYVDGIKDRDGLNTLLKQLNLNKTYE